MNIVWIIYLHMNMFTRIKLEERQLTTLFVNLFYRCNNYWYGMNFDRGYFKMINIRMEATNIHLVEDCCFVNALSFI